MVSIPDLLTELGTDASLKADETLVGCRDLVFNGVYVAVGS